MVFLGYSGTGFSHAGGDTYFIEISKRLASSHDLCVLTTSNGEKLLKTMGLTTKVQILSFPLIDRFPLFFEYFWRSFAALFNISKLSSDFDIVISTSPLIPDIFATSLFSVVKKVKPAIYHHGFVTSVMLNEYDTVTRFLALTIQRRFLTLLITMLNFTIFALPVTRRDLLALNVPEDRIKELVNGLDTIIIDHVNAGDQSFDGVFIGRIVPGKGVLKLPDIWSKVVNRFPNAKLAILGTGVLLQELKSEINAKKLENNILLLGWVPELEKYAILKSSKIFVFPSYVENWSIAVSEAMYCGLPCVLYELDAYDIYLDGVIKIRPGRESAFTEAIIRLLVDDDLRNRISDNAKKIVSSFSWDKIAQKHEADLLKAIKLE